MRDNVSLFFGLFFALMFLIVGAMLVNDAVSTVDPSQSIGVVGGAAVFSLGVTIGGAVLRVWWRSRQMYAKLRNGSDP
jgi:hypothetical protein